MTFFRHFAEIQIFLNLHEHSDFCKMAKRNRETLIFKTTVDSFVKEIFLKSSRNVGDQLVRQNLLNFRHFNPNKIQSPTKEIFLTSPVTIGILNFGNFQFNKKRELVRALSLKKPRSIGHLQADAFIQLL